jgi:hypothetical protein
MPLVVRGQVIDIRADNPKDTDRFLVDTNAWYWLFYPRVSQAPSSPLSHQLADYPSYIKKALGNKATLHCYALTFAELAHNIEKAEREIYENQAAKKIRPKEFRHDYVNQRRKIIGLITDTWADVMSVSNLLDMELSTTFMQSALSLYPAVGLDGYDLFMAEAAFKTGVVQIITDDADFATVSGLTVFTSNQKVIQAASSANKLISR